MIESVRLYVYGAFCVHYDLVCFCYSAVIISAVDAVLRAHPLCLGLLEAGWGKGTLRVLHITRTKVAIKGILYICCCRYYL